MTDTNAAAAELSRAMAKASTFAVEDAVWGYKIKSGRRASFAVALGQAVSFFFGVCFLTAALGILLLPTLFFGGDFGAMRVGSAALFGAGAAYLLWFASRGTHAEVHVDTSTNEIREVIANRAGKPTTVAVYGFETISGIFLENNDQNGLTQLVLHSGDGIPAMLVAEGTEVQLIPLRDRLARDLVGQPKGANSRAA